MTTSMSTPIPIPISISNSNSNANFQANVNVNVNFNVNVNVNFQFSPNQCQFTLNLLLGQQKWSCLRSNQVNDNLPSIGILLSQTFNWYLVTGQVPGSIQKRTTCTYLYTYASGQTASSICRTVCTQLIL
jgi:hypothetical protein